ncbi:prepilin-type N-terminal cleavage/methylation domain-containing protein [Duodenibacillus massiliensis]|uniref:prepilin-type N-terminal cleavage/methylation domain-containing protein n=1 Tax=Duodenibacillus massiliensis TaxID=1852381 RepID=UPI00258925EA|nr:prepilin-type N-terminal cleavage/methylation domain-containing protein [uncultured Duodenibacillus sp.]
MGFNGSKKGFTLVEIVLVLVLLGILASVAVSKYYDLKNQARYAEACAFAKRFVADLNSETAKLMLAGEPCYQAKLNAFNNIGAEFLMIRPDAPVGAMALDGAEAAKEESSSITVWMRRADGKNDAFTVPSGIISCKNSTL